MWIKRKEEFITHGLDDKILTFSTLDVRVEEDNNFGGGVLKAHVTPRLGPHSLRGSQDSNLGVPPEVLVQRLPKMFCKFYMSVWTFTSTSHVKLVV